MSAKTSAQRTAHNAKTDRRLALSWSSPSIPQPRLGACHLARPRHGEALVLHSGCACACVSGGLDQDPFNGRRTAIYCCAAASAGQGPRRHAMLLGARAAPLPTSPLSVTERSRLDITGNPSTKLAFAPARVERSPSRTLGCRHNLPLRPHVFPKPR